MKPPAKASISPEAVQACLYYLHVDTPKDHELRISLEQQKKIDEAEILAERTNIVRKPLPDTPYLNYPATERPPTPPKAYPFYQPAPLASGRDTQGSRYAARGVHVRLNSTRKDETSRRQRKPVGPRPLDTDLTLSRPTEIRRKPVGSPTKENQPPVDGQSELSHVEDDSIRTNLPQPGCPHLREAAAFSITVIRRDPSTGSQWNVGSIRIPDSEGAAGDEQKPLVIELNAPGYQRFNKAPILPSTNLNGSIDANDLKALLHSTAQASPAETTNPEATASFIRVVSRCPRKSSGTRLRSNSDDIRSALRDNLRKGGSHSRPQFSFVSPWQGTCAFFTNVDGRSLRCRHTLPGSQQTDEDMGVGVAEIRFNLPWLGSKPRNTNAQPRHGPLVDRDHRLEQALVSKIRQLKHKTWTHQDFPNADQQGKLRHDSDSEDERLDLSLGREKAGGGFTGKSAKLGKLIIEDEGLKMCDLVVSACMGIFWQQFHGHTGRR